MHNRGYGESLSLMTVLKLAVHSAPAKAVPRRRQRPQYKPNAPLHDRALLDIGRERWFRSEALPAHAQTGLSIFNPLIFKGSH